jgi:hypothetical protein
MNSNGYLLDTNIIIGLFGSDQPFFRLLNKRLK